MLYPIRLSLFILFSLTGIMSIYWWGYQSPLIGIDDANIYFVYMRNLAEGQGFVWNPGGEKVEGFTSLIWTLYGAFAYTVWPDHFNIILLITNFFLIFFSLRSLLLFARKLNHTQTKSLTPTEIVITSLLLLPLGFVEWGIMALMETGLWTFLIVHLTLQLCSNALENKPISIARFSLMIFLLDLTRPEGMALGLIFIGLFAILLMEKSGLPALKSATLPLLVHILTLTSLTIWRLSYFGYPFPNTYYAKVSASIVDNLQSGLRYLFVFFHSYPHAAFFTALLFAFLIRMIIILPKQKIKLSGQEKALLILVSTIFAGLMLPVFTGGDHFKYSRFYQPYLPLMYLAATSMFLLKNVGLSFASPRIHTSLVIVPVIFGILFISKYTVFDFLRNRTSVNYNILGDFTLANNARTLGNRLNETFGGLRYQPSLGALATGSIAFSYKGKTIDLLGLNNTTMAHANRIKKGYRNHASFSETGFWHLSPDMLGTFMGADIVEDTTRFVLPENTSRYRTSDITYLCYKGIFDDNTFRSCYIPALVKHRDRDYFVFSYYKRSFLSSLNESGDYFIRAFERKPVPSHSSVATVVASQ